jgi:hypothetical protein
MARPRRSAIGLLEEVRLYEHFFDTYFSLRSLGTLLVGLGEKRPAALELTIYKYMLLEVTKLYGGGKNRSIVKHLLAGSSWVDEPDIAQLAEALTRLWNECKTEGSFGHTIFALRDRYIAHNDFTNKLHPSDYVRAVMRFGDELPALLRTVLAGLGRLYERLHDVQHMLVCADAMGCDVIDLARKVIVRVENFPAPIETDADGRLSRATIERIQLAHLAELWAEVARASGLSARLNASTNPWIVLDPTVGIRRNVDLATASPTDRAPQT